MINKITLNMNINKKFDEVTTDKQVKITLMNLLIHNLSKYAQVALDDDDIEEYERITQLLEKTIQDPTVNDVIAAITECDLFEHLMRGES